MARDQSAKAWSAAIVLLILLLGFFLRIFRLDFHSLWWDEGITYVSASNSLGFLIERHAGTADIHPPLFSLLLHFWINVAGHSEFALRFLSVIFGVLTVAVVYVAGKRFFGFRAGIFAALVAAVSPFYVFYSQELRMYALVTLSTLISSLLLFEIVRREAKGNSPRHLWLFYTIAAAISLNADYFAVFVVIFQNLFVVFWLMFVKGDRLHRLVKWGASQLAIVLLYLPWLYVASRALGGYGQGRNTTPGVESELIQLWRAFNLGMALRIDQGTLLLWAIAVILGIAFIVGTVRWARGSGRGSILPFLYVLCYVLVPILAFIFVLRFRPFFHPRYLLVATPGYYLLIGLALATLWDRWRTLALSVGPAVVIMWGLLVSQYYFEREFAKDDTRQTAEFLTKETRAEDLVIWEPYNPIGIYYRGSAKASEFEVNPETTSQRLTQLCGGCRRIFSVTWYQSDNDPWEMLPHLMEKHGTRGGQWQSKGYTVIWYQLPPNIGFSIGELRSSQANFGDKILLDGFAWAMREDMTAKKDARDTWATFRWRSLAKMEDDFAFFIQLFDEQGRLMGQDDGMLWSEKRLPTSLWQPDETVLSFANPKWAEDVPPGRYQVGVGIYWPKTPLQRLKLTDSGGDVFMIGSVEVK